MSAAILRGLRPGRSDGSSIIIIESIIIRVMIIRLVMMIAGPGHGCGRGGPGAGGGVAVTVTSLPATVSLVTAHGYPTGIQVD